MRRAGFQVASPKLRSFWTATNRSGQLLQGETGRSSGDRRAVGPIVTGSEVSFECAHHQFLVTGARVQPAAVHLGNRASPPTQGRAP